MDKVVVVLMLLWRTVLAAGGAVVGGVIGAAVGWFVVTIIMICLAVLIMTGILPMWVGEYIQPPRDGAFTDQEFLVLQGFAWVGVLIGAFTGFFYDKVKES